jgi:hypothetical protein
MLNLYRIPHRARVVVCRWLLIGAGMCYGAGLMGASWLTLAGGITCSAAWWAIPERTTRPERQEIRR